LAASPVSVDPLAPWSRFARIRRPARPRRPVRPDAMRGRPDHENVTSRPRQGKNEVIGPGTRGDIQSILGQSFDNVALLFPVHPHLLRDFRDFVFGNATQIVCMSDVDTVIETLAGRPYTGIELQSSWIDIKPRLRVNIGD